MFNTGTKTNNKLIEAMFGAGVHYGYSKSRRHPSTSPFIFGAKNKVEIFDLEKTSKALEDSFNFVLSLGEKNKQILFVSGKKEAGSILRETAKNLGVSYVAGRWIGGTLTNFSEIRKRIQKFLDLQEKKEKGELSKYTKKERLLIDRDIMDLESKFGGLMDMQELPSALFVIDSEQEKIAVTEAQKMGIPVISISSSDCNIKGIDYPIPGNDSSLSSIKFFVSKIADAYKEGQKKSKLS
ncbi:MAG TPA: 30S ribosomal protein S2 [Candidatus Paceibacterota bacterium]|jgi:small subunit ribosomal protein S2|nr:30S ribosomal protein S2 [Parcubacteria group bacterium]MDP6119460.1 30S ribosomal protein S2 [Candidatus Paceibacterota bacterium]HJN62891.1 30S ribosomal protein S2 [Candidatus Paceibacterota bacterium]|tara:strand:+ start:840 stop:1556 length:717 start_codon:yes stop_codon:yes gene_type:complete